MYKYSPTFPAVPRSPLFSFRIRVSLVDVSHATVLNQLPVEASTLYIEIVNNRAQLWALTHGVRLQLLQGSVDLPADARLCISAVDTIKIDELYHQKVHTPSNDSASLCMAFSSPATSTYNILTSPTLKLEVASNSLIVNNVATQISVASSGNFVLSASYTDTHEIEVSLWTDRRIF